MRHSVVTGGAGFIGSHLTEALLGAGHTVHVIDNLSTGHLRNLEHLKRDARLVFHECDINDFGRVAQIVRGARAVFHLAALADIVPSIEKPLDYARANVNGTLTLLEAARLGRVGRFIYTASSSCYGIPDVYPTNEAAPARPQYPYALTKYLGEQSALHWCQVYGLPVVSLRLFNVYGPRSRTNGTYGAMFGVFLAQKLAGRPFTVVGDGTQCRDFTFVSDVVDAFVRAEASSCHGEIFNVGSGRKTSVLRVVELLQGEASFIPKRPGEPELTHADASKLQRELGWQARVSIEQGVAMLLQQIEYWRDAPVWTPESIADATAAWFGCLGGVATPASAAPGGSP